MAFHTAKQPNCPFSPTTILCDFAPFLLFLVKAPYSFFFLQQQEVENEVLTRYHKFYAHPFREYPSNQGKVGSL